MNKGNQAKGFFVTSFLFLFLLLFLGCKKDAPTQPEPSPTGEGTLLLSRLSVAMVPGGTEMVEITATNQNDIKEDCSVVCDNTQIANISLNNSEITITGVSYGNANITVTSQSGMKKTFKVQVYDEKVLDTGELLIAFVDSFTYRGYYQQGSFWHPITSNGFQALGSLSLSYASDPNGTEAIMVVKAKEGSDALAPPVSYSKMWQGGFGTCWIPVPPEGYVALGMVVLPSFSNIQPSLNDVVCVREDLTVSGVAGTHIFNMDNGFISWQIEPPDAGAIELSYLGTGTFVALGSIYYDLNGVPPLVHSVMNVLKVPLPLLSEAPSQSFQPKLKGFDTPPAQTVPVFSRAMLIPHTIVKDPKYSLDQIWRVRNSPIYMMEREVYFKLLYHNYNQTSQVQTNSVTIKSGITTTQSNSYWNSTAVSISVEGGINFKIFSSKISSTVTKSFGYEQQNSVSELQEKEVSTSINTAPGKAAAVWQKFNRFVLYRHNGTKLEIVGTSLEFGIDSYVTDEYPD